MDMGKIEDWLGGFSSLNTRRNYQSGVNKFEEYYGKPIETLIGSKDAGKIIEKFYVWLKDREYAQNTCKIMLTGPVQFLKYFDTPVKYRKSLRMFKSSPRYQFHLPKS